MRDRTTNFHGKNMAKMNIGEADLGDQKSQEEEEEKSHHEQGQILIGSNDEGEGYR